jgi:hypothetical protein
MRHEAQADFASAPSDSIPPQRLPFLRVDFVLLVSGATPRRETTARRA